MSSGSKNETQKFLHCVQSNILAWSEAKGVSIIDKTTWELAQVVRQGKRRRTAKGGIDKHSGLLYCADCNSKMYFIRGTTRKTDPTDLFAADTESTWMRNNAHRTLSKQRCLTRSSLKKSTTQQIDIYFRYIGKLAPETVA